MASDTVMMIASSPGRLPGTGPGRQGSAEDLRTRGVYSNWPIVSARALDRPEFRNLVRAWLGAMVGGGW